ncbi:response regulator transcription factor [Jeotgalibacillus salarius]|uniref:Response regulator transcription factor n=1 Tax=Jeotgalibacillus salarius TaxID=546023 RepID=A0A4Y8LN78_9BACL|nr:response regulator transcription factor [Jeotgalibacillus salarius]TFE02203.1 response regulator transcription factor [Jeotgalibacillus salarius]
MSGYKVLVVEDEPPMRELIASFLIEEHYEVAEAANGVEALQQFKSYHPDVMVVDIMMPFMDGFELLKEIRQLSEIPFIFLSARGEEWDKVKGLRLGADDYIVKPFHSGELIARIETVLRRSGSKTSQQVIRSGNMTLDLDYMEVRSGDRLIPLTKKEFEMLALLIKYKGHTVTRARLMELVWGPDYPGSERTVDTHMKTLRMKLPEESDRIKTVRGVGYRLEETP